MAPERGSAIQFWSWRKLLRLLFDRQLRRSYRLFRLFPPVPCRYLLDVGADRGTFTDRALRCFEAERVWLIEANPDAAAALQKKYASQPRCKVISCAIGDKAGEVQFHIGAHASSSAVQFGPAPVAQDKVVRVVTVPAISLDELFEQEQIAEVDLMKVDIQGAERMLIEGGQQALKRIRLIYIEVLFETECPTAALFGELHQLLTAAGFKLRLLHRLRQDEHGFLQQGDALYVRIG
jgi:FkbM family methyltransferase